MVQPSEAFCGVESTSGVAPTSCEAEGTAHREGREEVVGAVEEEGGARVWSLSKMAADVGADKGSSDMRGAGTAVVSEEGAEVPLVSGIEAVECVVVSRGC